MGCLMETLNLRRRLPAVGRLLADPTLGHLARLYGRDVVRVQARRELDLLRAELATSVGDEAAIDGALAALPSRIATQLEARLGTRLRRVINATGIAVHTNLGRSPLPPEVIAEIVPLLGGYCDLEMDLESGRRSERNRRVGHLLQTLVGAEAAMVANNNAGALVLALATLAAGREVIVSRGELVEIGGSFRIPEILEAAGARLVEVGTTNRTRLADYERAITADTALLLKVHPSNYRLTGFVATVEPTALASLGHAREIPVLIDEGSGLLRPSPRSQLRDHPSIAELLAAGCDLVCGSGDKLLGGPQAGLLVGRRDLIERCRRHPLARVLRPDRFAFAALEAVLRHHLAGRPLPLDALWTDPATHRQRLERLAARLGAEIVAGDAFIGGGAAPEAAVTGEVLALHEPLDLLARLRTGEPPVVAYLRDGRLMLDLRTVVPVDDDALASAIEAARRAGEDARA